MFVWTALFMGRKYVPNGEKRVDCSSFSAAATHGVQELWKGSVVTGTGGRGPWPHAKGELFVLQAIHVLTGIFVEDHGRVRTRL